MHRALACVDLRYGLMWGLGVYSGLRVSDMLKLRLNDVRGPVLKVLEQKSGKHKEIKIDIALRMEIDQHIWFADLREGDFLFYRRLNTKQIPMSRQWARRVIASTASNLGLLAIGTHSMRKIYACALYRATGSLNAVQKALNHSKIETTMIYLKDIL